MTEASNAHRLPRTVAPVRYDLTLAPDIATASFTGEERVTVEVLEPVREIVLNAVDLEIHEAELTSLDGVSLNASVTIDKETERAVLTLDEEAAAGEWTLHLTFSGILTDKLKGFYLSRFVGQDGVEQVIATTQFEATDARRAFPCWDEPDRKAVFGVTLVVDDDLLAVSNAAEVEATDLGNGKRQLVFADTMKMSTYLVCFVVGPLVATEAVDVDGVPLRVICVPGKEHLADFGLELGAHSLRFFTEWFGIPYPGDKLDLIALPDFAAGAMENVGAVTFREAVLLVDRDNASRVELQRVADVVAHEVAHMWFGDLVTMKWWNGIWLNEAFATFMELLCVDAYRPEWERWVTFGRSRAGAMLIDGLASTRTIEYPVGAPEEADGMFDVLTYDKGAAVLRMLEQHLGAEPFREGIRQYLNTYAYGNTETGYLWDSIEAATNEPARSTMDSWIFQEGHPIITVDHDGARVSVSQQRFRYDGGEDPTTWHVPISVRAGTPDGEVRSRTLLTDRTGAIDLEAAPSWVVVNEDGSGFFRVRYSTALLRKLTADLQKVMSPLERLNLVNDAWAAAFAGVGPLSDFLELCGGLVDEDDPNVWTVTLDALERVHTVTDGDSRLQFAAWARGILRPAFDRHGWAPPESAGSGIGERQGALAQALGTWAADAEIVDQAREHHSRYLADRGAVAPDLAAALARIVAYNGGAAEYESFVQRWKNPETPQEETRYLYELGSFRDPALVERSLDIAFTEARTQNAPWVLMTLLGNETGMVRTWERIEAGWEDMLERFPNNLIPRMVAVTSSAGPEIVERVAAFLVAHPMPGHEKQIEQVLERGRINVAFRRREAAGIGALLGPA